MSDDSFIREVEDELRQDQAKALWKKFGPWLIAACVAVVLFAAGKAAWDYYVETQSGESGDRFLAALTAAREGKHDEAIEKLNALEADGYGAYPVLARLRAATVLVDQGKTDEAVKAFDAVAADSKVTDSIREMAKLRAALLLVDTGSYADVAARAELLSVDGNPLRHSAREAMGLAAWKDGRASDALKLFEQIEADAQAPANLRRRAIVMAELIRGSGEAGK